MARTWTARTALAALALASGLVAGCGTGEDTPPAADAGIPTTTLPSKAVLKTALLNVVDLPGSIPLPDSGGDAGPALAADPASCAGLDGGPGAETDPTDVQGPTLQLQAGEALRFYGSFAGLGTPEEISGFVTQLTSPAGIACGVDTLKAVMSQDVEGVSIDGSGLTGTGAPVAIGNGGGIISIRGKLKVERLRIPVGADMIVFRKGTAVAMVMVFAVRGDVVEGQAAELAQRIAGRLP